MSRKELGIKCFPVTDSNKNKSWYWQLPKPEGGQLKIPGLAEAQAKAISHLKEMKKKMGLS